MARLISKPLYIGSIVVIAVGLSYFLWSTYILSDKTTQLDTTPLFFGEVAVNAHIVNTPETLRKGLGGRDKLSDGEGMFFIFPNTDIHGIWMKDMRFAIDIIWMDEQLKIINVKEDVSPDTFPEVFYPEAPSRYVLEVQAGFAKKNSINIGDVASF